MVRNYEFEQADKRRMLERALEKAHAVLKESAINPQDFEGLYDPELLARHRSEVEAAFASFARRNEANAHAAEIIAFGTILEAIIIEQGELANWLGDTATTQKTADYDDIKGTDMLVEYDSGGAGYAHLGLAIDISSSDELRYKFDRIKEGLDAGTLTTVHYFTSPAMSFKGMREHVPRVVVGVDAHTAYDLIEAWLRGDGEYLARHPIQMTLLKQIELQLEASLACLPETAVAARQAVARDLELVQVIIKDKAKQHLDEVLETDQVYVAIQGLVKGWTVKK